MSGTPYCMECQTPKLPHEDCAFCAKMDAVGIVNGSTARHRRERRDD